VDEDVLAVRARHEAVPLLSVEKLDGADWHSCSLIVPTRGVVFGVAVSVAVCVALGCPLGTDAGKMVGSAGALRVEGIASAEAGRPCAARGELRATALGARRELRALRVVGASRLGPEGGAIEARRALRTTGTV
jgi:hypothetical protein